MERILDIPRVLQVIGTMWATVNYDLQLVQRVQQTVKMNDCPVLTQTLKWLVACENANTDIMMPMMETL